MTQSRAWLELVAPDEVTGSLEQIDLDGLQKRGFEGLVLDVDNTLVAWGSCEISEGRERWVRAAMQRFAVCLLSNSVRGKRIRTVAEQLDVPWVSVWGLGRKPFAGGLLRSLQATGTAPAKTVLVGDQLLADVLGGNRLGMRTVWVKRISRHEFPTTKLCRPLERLLTRKLRQAGMMPVVTSDGRE